MRQADLPVRSPGWRRNADLVPPTVLVLGGFLTAPVMYRRFAERLDARGAAAVVVSQVWLPDWLLATSRGLAAITTRAGRALLAAVQLAEVRSEGAPVLVIGHSAGGLVARLLTAPEPFPGRRFGAAPRIGAIVTLGAPHRVAPSGGIGRRVGTIAAGIADRTVPGAFYAPEIGYLSVASQSTRADPSGSGHERIAFGLYRSLLGGEVATGMTGDRLVPVVSALLPGSAHVVLERAVHGPGSRAPWYGAEGEIDTWWPRAVEIWRDALRYRAERETGHAPAPRIVERGLEEAG